MNISVEKSREKTPLAPRIGTCVCVCVYEHAEEEISTRLRLGECHM